MSVTKLNGCHDRPAFRSLLPVQDGWWMDGHTRVPRMVPSPFRLSPDCQYTKTDLGKSDPGCTRCKWKTGNQVV